MNPEVWAAVVGALVGALLAGVISWAQQQFSARIRQRERVEENRLVLVREIMRHRSSSELYLPLNELPLVFGDDAEAMNLHRQLLQRLRQRSMGQCSGEQCDSAMLDLINYLAQSVGLPPYVRQSDIAGVFSKAEA